MNLNGFLESKKRENTVFIPENPYFYIGGRKYVETYPDSVPGSIKVFIIFPLKGVIGASLIVSKASGVVCSSTGLWCTNASNVRFWEI